MILGMWNAPYAGSFSVALSKTKHVYMPNGIASFVNGDFCMHQNCISVTFFHESIWYSKNQDKNMDVFLWPNG